jgi:hypothetical protein
MLAAKLGHGHLLAQGHERGGKRYLLNVKCLRDRRVDHAVGVPVPAVVVVAGLDEAEPFERGAEHGGVPQRYLVMALNSSTGARSAREAGPIAASRQWSM